MFEANSLVGLLLSTYSSKLNKNKIVFITSVYKMQYINLGIVFLPLTGTLIALDLGVVIANRTQLPQYYYQFSIIYLLID